MHTKISKLFPISILLLLASIILPSINSCTHPDGDIGILGGIWLIESIEIDGIPDEHYGIGKKDRTTISFQGGIFCLAQIDGPEIFGHWDENANTLTLDGSHGAGALDMWPSNLGFGNDLVVSFNVVEKNSKRMIWTLECSDSHKRNYNLRKI